MASLTGFNTRFTFSWSMSVLALLTMLLLLRLGFWQLHRADEKKKMIEAHRILNHQPVILWGSNEHNWPKQYQNVQVSGEFQGATFLLDNQHYQHQFGYQVISPLLLNDGKVLLVDRGWIAGDITRQSLPVIETPSGVIDLKGSTYFPSKLHWRLGAWLDKERDNQVVIEFIDTQLIGQFLHKSVYPFIIRLGKYERYGYSRDWPIVSMSPERHYAYAVQWFALALAVLIIYTCLSVKS